MHVDKMWIFNTVKNPVFINMKDPGFPHVFERP